MEMLKNTEFIQSIIRSIIGLLTFAYISTGIDSGYFETTSLTLRMFAMVFFSFTFVVALSIFWKPVSLPRRYLALCFDIGSATFSSSLTGGINSVFILVYLWIYIGYGTRYGKNFLVAAVVLTMVGYNILLLTEDAWHLLTLDALAFLTLIIALPLYLYSMQKRLQRAVTEAEQANQAKTEFLSNMTHQIRTPIGGVVGMIDLLDKTELSPQQKQYLQALSQSSNSLQEIIEDIVDFSRIERGNISFTDQSFEPRSLINSLIHSLAPFAHERNLQLNCYINEKFPQHVFSDAQRLRQLLSNLIRHAIENCSDQGVYVQLEGGEINNDGQINVRISIQFNQSADTKRLYASDLPTSDEALPLRVGSQLTRLMGGSFDIQYENSSPRFVLNFNWKLDKQQPAKNISSFKDRRVLIFEPDVIHREILEKYCAQMGVETYLTDGKDNLIAHILWSQKKNRPFDGIILCENIKDNSSQALVKRVRGEANCQTPILYATYIQNIELNESRNIQNVQSNAIKPLSLEELSAHLKKLFDIDQQSADSMTYGTEAKNILLAEDSEINAGIVYSHLTDMGHNVDIATDGTTALYAMHKHHYDIVFMDLNMPKTDGIEATQQWRKLEPRQSHLPIVALTAKATSEDRQRCLDAGMDDFLTKPVTAQQLAEMLDKHL